jgi:hypothetical protein
MGLAAALKNRGARWFVPLDKQFRNARASTAATVMPWA